MLPDTPLPLTKKGKTIMDAMKQTYGDPDKAEQVFYASRNAGRITGVDPQSRRGVLSKKRVKRQN